MRTIKDHFHFNLPSKDYFSWTKQHHEAYDNLLRHFLDAVFKSFRIGYPIKLIICGGRIRLSFGGYTATGSAPN